MKKAVVLLNLGGPDNLDAVERFLFNLFYDKNIITIPNPIRYFLAKFISKKRAPIAKEIYKQIGNKSPILEETKKQAIALEKALNDNSNNDTHKVFIAMRHWHPFSYEIFEKVKEFTPDEIILLPLYPQFSTTTTKSSLDDWNKIAKNKLNVPTKTICSYHKEESFITAHVDKIKKCYDEANNICKSRILFSAHGLPEKIIKKGDPYQKQIEETVEAIIRKLGIKDLDYAICYQSRVGRLKWIGPSTDVEINRAGQDSVGVVIVPIAFVSEHSETLVELDIEYRHLAMNCGVKNYLRVSALGNDKNFIKALAKVCKDPESFKCNCYAA